MFIYYRGTGIPWYSVLFRQWAHGVEPRSRFQLVVQGTRSLRVCSRKTPKPRYSGHRPRSSTGPLGRRSRKAATDQVAGFGGIDACKVLGVFHERTPSATRCIVDVSAASSDVTLIVSWDVFRNGDCVNNAEALYNKCTYHPGRDTLSCHVSLSLGIRSFPS
jgi:hypothetical protein